MPSEPVGVKWGIPAAIVAVRRAELNAFSIVDRVLRHAERLVPSSEKELETLEQLAPCGGAATKQSLVALED